MLIQHDMHLSPEAQRPSSSILPVEPVDTTPRDSLHAHIASLLQELEASDRDMSPSPLHGGNQEDAATPCSNVQYSTAMASPSDQSFEDLLQQFRHLGAALQDGATPHNRATPRPASSNSDILSLITGMCRLVARAKLFAHSNAHIHSLQASSSDTVVMAVHPLNSIPQLPPHPLDTRAASTVCLCSARCFPPPTVAPHHTHHPTPVHTPAAQSLQHRLQWMSTFLVQLGIFQSGQR